MTPRPLALGGLVASAFALALFGGPGSSIETQPGERLGTWISFHGWSPEGHFIAYTRDKRRPTGKGRQVQEATEQLHRIVEDGKLAGYAPAFGKDLEAYATEHRYRVETLPRRQEAERRWIFDAPEGPYTVEVVVGRRLLWQLSYGGRVVKQRAFGAAYVDVDVALYPSPDRKYLLAIMHLDTGWMVDAAVRIIKLPPKARLRYAEAIGEAKPKADGRSSATTGGAMIPQR